MQPLHNRPPEFSIFNNLAATTSIKNTWRSAKFGFNLFLGNIECFFGSLTGNSALIEKGRIRLAVNFHRACKTQAAFAQVTLKEQLLVPARNLATKEVLRNKKDFDAYTESKPRWENEIGEVSIKDNKDTFALADGVCLAACMDLTRRIYDSPDPLNKESLIQITEAYEKGVSAQVAGNHALYRVYYPKGYFERSHFKVMTRSKGRGCCKLRGFGKLSKPDYFFAHMHGLYIDNSPAFQTAAEKIGRFSKYESSFEHLQEFHLLPPSKADEPPGIYGLSFRMGDLTGDPLGLHIILYIKLDSDRGFFFDPNYGLVECKPGCPHNETLFKILSMYPPPGSSKNYEVSSVKYTL